MSGIINNNNSYHHQRMLTSQPKEQDGVLEATILSAYDLPSPEAPKHVTLTVGSAIVASSGPPLARHKDRNSFRFSGKDSIENQVKLLAPLSNLYKSKLTIRLVYENKNLELSGEYELNQLRVMESKWIILTLAPSVESSTAAAAAAMTEEQDSLAPTLRIKLQLSGPYRGEIAALLTASKVWFNAVDGLEQNLLQVWKATPKLPFDKVYLAVPAVPIVTAIVVFSPVLAGVLMVGLPFLLPLILSVLGVSGGLLLSGGVVYSSTKDGRSFLGGMVNPFLESLVRTNAGQSLVYEVGPRPTPVSVAKVILPNSIWMKLAVSLLIDLIGSSSYLLPVVGEGLDIAWAPLQTIFIMAMYDPTSPNLKYVSFMEEILPFTDIVPTATIGWSLQYLVPQILGKNHQVNLETLVQTLAKVHPERTTARVPVTTP
jgi:hypothetical protein